MGIRTAGFCLWLLLVASTGFSLDKGATKEIPITTSEFPPFTWGQDRGSYNKIVNLIFRNLGYGVKWIYLPLKRLNNKILQGEIEVASASHQIFSSDPRFGVSTKLSVSYPVFTSIGSKTDPDDLESLKKRSLVSVIGMEPFVRHLTDNGVRIHFVTTSDSMMRMVENRRMDAAVFDKFVSKAIVHRLFPKKTSRFSFSARITDQSSGGILVFRKRNNPYLHLIGPINTELKKIIRSGAYRKVLEQFVGQGNVEEDMIPGS